jgi:hypothetical protein
MAKIQLDESFIKEMFPYMEGYENFPRKKKKATKKRLTKEINRAVEAAIQRDQIKIE